jgi:hypothetical protein
MSGRKKFNKYDLTGQYGVGFDANGRKFIFDLEDYEIIKDHYWYGAYDNRCKRVYFSAVINKKHTKLHRFLLNQLEFNKKNLIDHINADSCDNRKGNLRVCTSSQNVINVGRKINNTSGVTGVIWDKESGKWMSYISINRKQKKLGRFYDFEDAVNARKKAEINFYGEYRYGGGEII